jgi:hypothetical protein
MPLRDLFLRACVALGIAVALVTEILSPFHLLRRGLLIVVWLAIVGAAALRVRGRATRPGIAVRPVEAAIALACAAIAGIVAVTAWVSPPNSADAMAYHMPRVVHWAQAGSVAFFPTPYFNQVSLQPLAEYFALHAYLLTGGDHFVNLVTCAAFMAAIAGISALAGALGAGARGQAFTALFCATLPNGILQASGAKNEWMAALWLICAAYFAIREDALFTGLALGLALATKATAYLFAPPLMLAIVLIRRPPVRARSLVWIAAAILAVNTPQYIRNIRLSGSPLGFDSAQGDSIFRWRNEHPGFRSTISNFIRHTSDQLGDRGERWNQAVFHGALAAERALGIDPNDRDTTWPGARFAAPVNANHEANANNRWHLLLLSIAMVFAAATRKKSWVIYGVGLLLGYLLFCFYLKWQLFMGRLELPLFALAAPIAGAFLETIRPAIVPMVVCAFLLVNTRLPILQNWTRPLTGPQSLFLTARDDNYFRDMAQWDNRASYLSAVDLTARSGCTTVGIDIAWNQLEYPFQALLRERNPTVRFWHVGVDHPPRPCAVFCPDCAGVPGKVESYGDIGRPIEIGHFLLFLPPAR